MDPVTSPDDHCGACFGPTPVQHCGACFGPTPVQHCGACFGPTLTPAAAARGVLHTASNVKQTKGGFVMLEQHDRQSAVKKVAELIKDIDIAMLTTVEQDGSLRSRPMSTQQVEFDGDLWFFTSATTPKVGEIQRDQRVNVSYANPGKQRYVSVSGVATLVRDRAKIEELWNPVLKAWFPKGLEDPDLALLHVRSEQAEYWESPSGFIAQAVGLAQALATGKEANEGENEKLAL
jgi:general stress protein 26